MKTNERAILRVVVATGIASVVVQLLTIREFLAQFQGNEFVIALILFNWLILGGIGTLLVRRITLRRRHNPLCRLSWLSLLLICLSALQLLAIRGLRDIFFIHGTSVGFYPTLTYIFLTIAPFGLLLGFLLPYSLFVLRTEKSDYPAARIYITDNLGDVTGGALFSFALVYLASPMQALFLANLPLLVTTLFLFAAADRLNPRVWFAAGLTLVILGAALLLEFATLTPHAGNLVYYRESRYGRIAVHQDQEQYTLFKDGVPIFSNQNLTLAEETVHYPLSQLEKPQNILLISGEGGVMAEIQKYRPQTLDYVELDPEVTTVQFQFEMLKEIPALRVIHQDGRAYLAGSKKRFDAIIMNLPEPDTFQINRFYTDQFFKLAKDHLVPHGILSFSMQGFDNYLSEPQRKKLSSLHNTVSAHFKHVLLLPGQRIFFLCRDDPIDIDIPAKLERQGMATRYIKGYYYGNLTPERIDALNALMDPTIPINRDQSPQLMRLMFSQWFAKFSTSPVGFIVVLSLLSLVYLFNVNRAEFVLFSTGCMTMGSEILVIFAFQIFFGYIYLQIGLIITVFLAGLLPGAWFGDRLRKGGKRLLSLTDGFLIGLLGLFILILQLFGSRLPAGFFLAFGFMVSLVCGFQFPVALHLGGGGRSAVTRSFSADLMGAACGTLVTSVFLIPYFGIIWTTAGLIGLKLTSLSVIGTYHEKNKSPRFSFL